MDACTSGLRGRVHFAAVGRIGNAFPLNGSIFALFPSKMFQATIQEAKKELEVSIEIQKE